MYVYPKIPVRSLLAMRHLAPTVDPRPWLNGVWLHPAHDRLCIMATDGAVLGVDPLPYVFDTAPTTPPLFLPHATLDVIQTTTKGLVSIYKDLEITLTAQGAVAPGKHPDGMDRYTTYALTADQGGDLGAVAIPPDTTQHVPPNFARVIPSTTSGIAQPLDPRVLDRMQRYAMDCAGVKPKDRANHRVLIHVHHNGVAPPLTPTNVSPHRPGPAVVTTPDNPEFVGVVAPVNNHSPITPWTAPYWAR
jgi:hypothetical protein